jgi:hypothetical protein
LLNGYGSQSLHLIQACNICFGFMDIVRLPRIFLHNGAFQVRKSLITRFLSHHRLALNGLTRRVLYRVSVSSLFILAIFEETDKSIVRSPISTTSPPTMSALT